MKRCGILCSGSRRSRLRRVHQEQEARHQDGVDRRRHLCPLVAAHPRHPRPQGHEALRQHAGFNHAAGKTQQQQPFFTQGRAQKYLYC